MEPDPEVISYLLALSKTPRMEKDFPKMIPKRCEVCHTTTGLLRCSACSIYYYCGQAHQKADRATHRKSCDTIKGTKKQVTDIEARLRAQTPNPFEAERGRFWLSMTNRMYLKARFLHSEMQVRSWRRQPQRSRDNIPYFGCLGSCLRSCLRSNFEGHRTDHNVARTPLRPEASVALGVERA